MAKRSMKIYDFFGVLTIAVPVAAIAGVAAIVWAATN